MKPANFENPELRVMHQHLQRYSDSPFKVHCVMCGGLLLVGREMPGMLLRRRDCCTKCGQHYFYLDDKIDGEELDAREPEAVVAVIRLQNERTSPGRPHLMSVRVFAGAMREELAIAGVLTFRENDWVAFRDALFKGAPLASVFVEVAGGDA